MKKTRNGMRITGLLLTMVMLVALLGAFSLTASAAEGTAIDLSSLTGTYVISDSGEYTFEGSGGYGIKVESGNPRIVLNNASITVGEGSAIDIASGSNATIFVRGDNTIDTDSMWETAGGIFVAEGGTVNITSNGTNNILRAHGTLAAAIGGKYDYDNNESYNAGNISISNVTVYAYTNNYYAAAIGAAGVGTCGTINITNAVVYAYGAGDNWTSAPGIGSAWGLVGWPETIPVVIISDSELHTFRYNSASDYIGYLGDVDGNVDGSTFATGSINCGEGGSVKSSTIYCYTGLDATTTDKTVKYGALGGLLKEDGTCEGEHSFTGIICDNCGYCSCTHEDNTNGFCNGCGAYQPATLNEDGYYEIGNLGQLMWFAQNINTAHKVLLTADITIDNSVVWTPIRLQDGTSNSSIFNGDGHTITFANTNEGSTFGLFGSYNYSIIENLYLAGSITCNTADNVGVLVNSAYRTTIRNVISTCDITNSAASGGVGGLAGQFGGQDADGLYSLIENCAVYADIIGGGSAGGFIGNIWSGYQYCTVKNCAYVGNVEGSVNSGAIVGYNGNNSSTTSTLSNVYYCEADGIGWVGNAGNGKTNQTNVMAKTKAEFANGEVAYLLGEAFGQEIGEDAYPVLGGTPVGETFKMYGQQLNVGGDLSMKYYVTAFGDGVSTETLKMNFIFLGRETVVDGIYNAEMGMYVFTLEGINPQCMGDKIDAYLLLGDEEKASKLSYTVEENLLALREEYEDDEALVTLVNDILAYGTAASEYKNHNSMTDVYVGSDREIPEMSTDSLSWFEGYTVVFGQVNYLKIKVELRDIDSLYLDGVEITDELVNCIYKTSGIAPTDFDKQLYFEIYTSGVRVCDLSVSVNDYIYEQRNSATMGKLVKALYNYGVSAEIYNHIKTGEGEHTYDPTTYKCICGATTAALIDGTLGGKAEATEEDLAAMVELLRSYIENGTTTIIVTGSQPAKLLKDGYLTPVVSLAFEQLTYAYQDENIDSYWGTVDLIYQDVTEIVEYEFYVCDVLKSITLPNVTTVGDRGFWACYYLQTLTFGSVVTNITDNSGDVFYDLGYKIDGCNLVLNSYQITAEKDYQPNLETKTWWDTEWKSITLT